MSGYEDAAESIEQGTQEIVRGYPLAAGLTSVTDAINTLGSLEPLEPSLFPHLAATSLRAGPDEPLFDQYSAELAALLSDDSQSASIQAWKREELQRAAQAVQNRAGAFSSSNYGGIEMPSPAFPLARHPNAPAPPTPPTTASTFLNLLGFPAPELPTTAPSTPLPMPASSSAFDTESSAFFSSYLAEQKEWREAALKSRSAESRSVTPPSIIHPQLTGHANGHGMTSSPDPLMIDERHSQEAGPGPRTLAVKFNGHRYDSSNMPPSSDSHSSPLSSSSAASTPRLPKSSLSRSHSANFGNEEQQLQDWNTPSAVRHVNGKSGVESGVKRIKLTGAGLPNGSSKGTVKTSEGKDAVERLTDTLSDLFSADDSFVLDTSSSHLAAHKSPGSTASDFFRSTTTTSDNQPLLNTEFLRRLVKLLALVQSRDKGETFLREVEEGGIGRLLKMLERSWRGVEDLDCWPASANVAKSAEFDAKTGTLKGKGKQGKTSRKTKSPLKRRGSSMLGGDDEDDEFTPPASSPSRAQSRARSTRSRSRSVTPAPMETSSDAIMGDGEIWTNETLADFDGGARSLSNAILAIRAAIAVMTIAHLPKSLYSSDYILSLLAVLRRALDSFAFPLLEATPVSHLGDLSSMRPDAIAEVCDSVTNTIPLVSRLVQHVEMSEDIVISSIYLSLSPFFHEAASSTGKGNPVDVNPVGIKALRMAALGLVRTVFGRYSSQREWIVEEVLGNLTRLEVAKKGKGAFRLRNGAAIHTVSALLLHLVQTTPMGLCQDAAARIVASHSDSHLDSQDPPAKVEAGVEAVADTGSVLRSVSRDLLQPAFDSATKTARMITSYMLSKSCKGGKAASGSTESEYRAVFNNLVADLLTTLHLPEWPAAEVLLSVCCRSMMSTLSDPKSTHEINALKSLSLDHVGAIAARICQDATAAGARSKSKTLQQIVADRDIEELENLYAAQQSLIAQLARQDDTSTEFITARFGLELCEAAIAASASLAQFTDREQQDTDGGQAVKGLHDRLVSLATSCWSGGSDDDVFGPNSNSDNLNIDGLALRLSHHSALLDLYQPLLERIVEASESSAVAFRTKALRDIGLVVAQDAELFHQPNLRKCIQNRMHDSSPAVRDAAVELIGKYVVARPDLATQYLPQISERITDTGLSVRRRVVKLLKALYPVVTEDAQRIDICRKLVWRALDEDDNIKELAVDAIEELWLGRGASNGQPPAQLARIVMAVAGEHQERPPPVDEVLKLIELKHEEKGTRPPIERLRTVIEALIDGLIEDDSSLDVVSCIKTVYVLSATQPALLSTLKAQLLMPWLLGASTPQEQAICDYLLKIFRSAVVSAPKSSSSFGKQLQSALMPMLNKPPSNIMILQEIVACYCAVIRNQTHDFASMISVFRASAARLAGEIKKLSSEETRASVNPRTLPILCYLSALLCEHGGFDQIRSSYSAIKPVIDAITPKLVSEHVYRLLVQLRSLPVGPAAHNAALLSLGFLFRAYPNLMLLPPSMSLMDGVFTSGSPQTQLQLLRIIQDFLASQAREPVKKKAKGDTSVKIDELVGNVENFADSGVASAIAQRYIKQILSACLSISPPLQRVAVDILTSIARSGFSHPLTIAPVLVALTSSPDQQIGGKAFATLSLLHTKHASLLATRYAEPVKTSHSYAKAVAGEGGVARGFYGDASYSCLGRWYSLVQKEKRAQQLDFLKSITRLLEIEPDAPCSEDDLSFARFVAESLSSLEYKRQEEPMSVIHHLNAILAVSGLQVMHILELGTEAGGGLIGAIGGGSQGNVEQSAGAVAVPDSQAPSESLARQSVICGITLLLRDHLKQVYTITEAKMSKFVVGKKSTVGDRATSKRSDAPLALDDYARMPFALSPMTTGEDRVRQRDTYLNLVREDGTVGALNELQDDDESA